MSTVSSKEKMSSQRKISQSAYGHYMDSGINSGANSPMQQTRGDIENTSRHSKQSFTISQNKSNYHTLKSRTQSRLEGEYKNKHKEIINKLA